MVRISTLLALAIIFAASPFAQAGEAKPQKIQGELTTADGFDTIRKKSRADVHEVKLEAGKIYVIQVSSTMFDTFLRLENDAGKRLGQNDDIARSDLNSRLGFHAPKTGKYRIVVTSYEGGKTGKYTVSWQSVQPAGKAQIIKGELTQKSPANRGQRYHAHRVELKPTNAYLIDIESDAFDAWMHVVDGKGKVVAQDEDGGANRNSRLLFMPTPDKYRIVVVSQRPGGIGKYRLTVRAVTLPRILGTAEQRLKIELDKAFRKGRELAKMGKDGTAVAFFEKANDLAPKVFGNDHLSTAGIQRSLGAAYEAVGRYKDAISQFRRALSIRESKLGKDHPEVGVVLRDIANALGSLSRFDEGEKLFLRSLKLLERKGKLSIEYITALNNLSHMYYTQGEFKKAEAGFRRCLASAIKAFGPTHHNVAVIQNNLGSLFQDTGRYDEAEKLIQRSIDIHKSNLGDEHPLVANGLYNLAVLQRLTGRYMNAEANFSHCAKIRKIVLGVNHTEYATTLISLGSLYTVVGRFKEADYSLREALRICEESLVKNDHQIALALYTFADLYAELGQMSKAEVALLRSLEIHEKSGASDLDVAKTLTSLGQVYRVTGRYEKAESVLNRSRRIIESRFGKTSSQLSSILNALGVLYSVSQRHREAAKTYRQSLQLNSARFGKNHPLVVLGTHNLARAEFRSGHVKLAEDLMNQALAISRKSRGAPDPELLISLSGIYQATGKSQSAIALRTEALQIQQDRLDDVVAFSSEPAMFAFVDKLDGTLEGLINMAAVSKKRQEAGEKALTWTLRRKAVVFNALHRYRQVKRSIQPNGPFAKTLQRYRSVKKLLADYAVTPPKGLSPKEIKSRIYDLQKEATILQGEIHRLLGRKGVTEDSAKVTADAVRQRLRNGTALVEFIHVPIRNFKKELWHPPHYFAFVLTPNAKAPKLIDLGDAAMIDKSINAFRQHFADFQDKFRDCENDKDIQALEKAERRTFNKLAKELHARVFAPLRDALGSAKLVYLAADGSLNRIPFEALVDDQGKFLIENYRFAYLSSGRDLLRSFPKTAKGTVVFANPDFRLSAEERFAQAKNLLPKKTVVAMAETRGLDVRSIGWRRLPGAAAEAKDIQQALSNNDYGPVQTYVGPQALEEVLKAMPPPRVLHLATHGFFLDHEPKAPQRTGVGAGAARGRLKRADNPLLRSGIVLAGANNIGKKTTTAVEDGWLTAEEITQLNLHGTELVVLSACQTGLGDVKTGEGVYGLRRAFLLAGARTLVTSLFEVPDAETRALMKRFYARLKNGKGKLAALHSAQREMIEERRKTNGAAHPFFWASFVLVGDPGDVDELLASHNSTHTDANPNDATSTTQSGNDVRTDDRGTDVPASDMPITWIIVGVIAIILIVGVLGLFASGLIRKR